MHNISILLRDDHIFLKIDPEKMTPEKLQGGPL